MEEGLHGRVVVVEGRIDLLRGQGHGQRQVAAGDPLREAHQIGAHPGMLVGEEPPGAAKADGDLVGDVMDVAAAAQFAQLAQVDGRIDAHAGRALDQRLDDHPGDLLVFGEQQPLQVLEALASTAVALLAVGAAEAVRPLDLEAVEEDRPVDGAVEVAAAHRQGADGFAMVGVGQGDEAGLLAHADLLPVLETHLQRHLHRRGAVVGEEDPGQSRRRQRAEAGRQFHGGLVGEAGEDVVGNLAGLLGKGAVEARVVVAEEVDPPGGDAVEDAVAVVVDQVAPLTAGDGQRRQGLVVLLLGAGVPDMGGVEFQQFFFGHGLNSPRRFTTKGTKGTKKSKTSNLAS